MSDLDFRTGLYRPRLPIYKVASEIEVHPSRLSLYLNGRLPVPADVAEKLSNLITARQEAARVTGSY